MKTVPKTLSRPQVVFDKAHLMCRIYVRVPILTANDILLEEVAGTVRCNSCSYKLLV